ncbi:MAG: lysylphosphatidylglycerol synthase transmembrane domain-containing protein [Patescibacteria group bacterium]|nr:lysylphosphatidylglycerol synthase transmembrane domain-containing protein [Patescibacteria group bacterium]
MSFLVGILLFAVAMQQAGIGDILKTIFLFPSLIIILVFLLNFGAICVIGSWRWKIIIEAQNSHKVNFWKVLRAKLAGFTVSYITPSALIGGEPVRAYMIKEEIGYDWEKSFASVVIDGAIYFFSLFLLMLAGFLFLINYFSLPLEFFCGFGIIVIGAVFILYLFYSRMLNKNTDGEGFFMFIIGVLRLNKIKAIRNKEKNIKKTERIITQFFKNKKKVFLKAFFLAILEIVFYLIVICVVIFHLRQADTAFEFIQSVPILFLMTLANFVPIPGSLGSFEAALTFIFELLNLGKSNGFALGLIHRFVNIILVVIGFFILIHFELTTVSRKFSAEAPEALLKLHRFFKRIIRNN